MGGQRHVLTTTEKMRERTENDLDNNFRFSLIRKFLLNRNHHHQSIRQQASTQKRSRTAESWHIYYELREYHIGIITVQPPS